MAKACPTHVQGFPEVSRLPSDSHISLVSEILRHALSSSVAGLASNLRSDDQISCIFWLIHSDLHELRASAALEYISTIVARLEPMIQFTDRQTSPEFFFLLEQNSHRGKVHVRLKCRNGRVKLITEEFNMEHGAVKFTSLSSENTIVNQNLLPKVQFNLQLSEKERVDREKVLLPFEHQEDSYLVEMVLLGMPYCMDLVWIGCFIVWRHRGDNG